MLPAALATHHQSSAQSGFCKNSLNNSHQVISREILHSTLYTVAIVVDFCNSDAESYDYQISLHDSPVSSKAALAASLHKEEEVIVERVQGVHNLEVQALHVAGETFSIL
jgi:hypothetical protein